MMSGSGAVRCDVVQAEALADADRREWLSLCAANAAYASPLLQPCFTQIVAKYRKDVRIALYRRGARLVGVFAFHLRPGRFARPVGAPFADFSGPVLAQGAGLTPAQIMQLADVRTYRFAGLVDPWGVFGALGLPSENAHLIDLSGMEASDYLEQCRTDHAKRFKNFRRLINGFAREGNELTLEGGAPPANAFDQLMVWKSAQFRKTGRLNLIEKRQTLNILLQARDHKSEEVEGYMLRLLANGKMIAGHFGLRSQSHFHPWIAAYHPDFSAHSPGSLLLYKTIGKMPDLGLQTCELAGGHGYYKKYFARNSQGTLTGQLSLTGQGDVSVDKVSLIDAGDPSWRARFGRRLDHIAVCETRTLARVKDIADAVLTARVTRPQAHKG